MFHLRNSKDSCLFIIKNACINSKMAAKEKLTSTRKGKFIMHISEGKKIKRGKNSCFILTVEVILDCNYMTTL